VNRTVLIADDDVNAQIIAETLLRVRGVPVRRAADSGEVRDILDREDIAVVVVDISLPDMNGFELLRHLRGRFGALRSRRTPRVLAVTSREETEVERFAYRLGADAFLRKPLAPHQFIATIESLLANGKDFLDPEERAMVRATPSAGKSR